MFRGEGGRRTSSRREKSLATVARSRVAANLLLRNFGSSSAAKRRESVLEFHQQMENCEKEMSAQVGDGSGSDPDSDDDRATVERGFKIV